MSSKSKKLNKVIRYTVIVLAVLTLITSAILLLQAWENKLGVYDDVNVTDTVVTHNGIEYELKDNIETFLVLGLDKFDSDEVIESYNNDKQADFLMLFVFDNAAETCTAIHINRDTMVDISVLGVAGNRIDTVNKQIALAHTYGNGRDVSCRNTADSVSNLLLDMKVNHYVSVTMDSVAIINDHIGGVKVKVLDDFTGIDDTLVKGKTVTLKGDHALNYVRSRYGLYDSTNLNRMKRQQQYLEALYEKAINLAENDEEFAVEALLKMADYIVSDRSISQLQDLADKFIEYEFIGIKTLKGKSEVGEKHMEFYADEASVKEVVFDLFYNEKTK